jgi:hypothetical protein
VAIAVGTIVLVAFAGGGWYFSGQIDARALDGESRRNALAPSYDIELVRVEDRTVALRMPDAPGSVAKEGVFGIRWAGGYGQVATIRMTTRDLVVRDFELLTGTPPEPGAMAQLDTRAYPGDPSAVGLSFDDVTFEGELGRYPAWMVPGSRRTWAIVVHGNSMTREDALRVLPTIAAEGFPTLVISYRNDPGAPEDPSGKLRYGATEWRDLESAVRYALDAGAEDVIVVGFSMGGAIVTRFLERSGFRDDVRGAILEAPVLDFGWTVDVNASRERLPLVGLPLPGALTATAKWMATIRFGADWGAMDHLSDADRLDVPILLIHGTEDLDVPIATSEALAEARPDLVTFVRVAGAAHMEAWNVDPDRYEERVASFLRDVSER